MTGVNTTFGSLQFDGNRPSISTSPLGIDIGSLVNNLVEIKRLPILDREVQLTENSLRIAALEDLKSIAQGLQVTSRNLRNPTLGMGGQNVFAQKAAFAQTTNGTNATQYASIIANKNAEVGDFTLKVNRLARTDVVNSSVNFTAPTDTPLAADGDLVLNGTVISLTETMSLTQIRDAINASAADSKVRASIIKVNDTTYRLNLQSTTTGNAIDFTGSDADINTSLGLAASGETNESLSSEIEFNGITLTRSTNSFSDVASGITFDLFSADPNVTINVEVKQDAESIKIAIADFVETYNAFVDFAKIQRKVGADGKVSADAILFNESLLRSMDTQLKSMLSTAVGGVDGINNLREAGITFNQDNKLVINDAVLDEAILNKGDEIERLFAFKSATTNHDFITLSRPKNIGAAAGQEIDIRILETDANGTVLAAEITYNGNTFAATIESGGVIVPPAGSSLEGFKFGYAGAAVNAGDPPVTTTIKPTQGIADVMGFLMDDMLRLNTGSFDTTIKSYEDKNVRVENQIFRIEEQVALYKERLLAQFLAVEQNISVLTNIQNSLKAQFDAMNNNNR